MGQRTGSVLIGNVAEYDLPVGDIKLHGTWYPDSHGLMIPWQNLVVIRRATPEDFGTISELLRANGMRTEGVMAGGTCYWVAEDGARLQGAVGLELGNKSALLRSAIVAESERGRGVGRELTEWALQWAWVNGYSDVYCFSTDAGPYWLRRGFRVCPVDEVVRALPEAPQVRLFAELGWLPTEVAYRIGADGARAATSS